MSRRWLVNVRNAFQFSRFLEEAKVQLASCLLKDRAREWWGEVRHALGGEAIESMTWENFVTRFRAEIPHVI